MTSVHEIELQISTVGASRPKRQFLTHPSFYQYRQLVALVALVNTGIMICGISAGWWSGSLGPSIDLFAHMALVNFAIAILVRQQHVVNFMYWAMTRIPRSWPLWIRWPAAKVYQYGGLHASGTVAGSLWLMAFAGGIGWYRAQGDKVVSSVTLWSSLILTSLLTGMIVTASRMLPRHLRTHPSIRH